MTANPLSKVYGSADPALTYGVSGLVNGDTSAVFSGALSRASGENVGSYAISQGTLSAGGNYTIAFTGANFSITQALLNVTANPLSKVYGSADPALTFVSSGFVNGDSAALLTGSLTRAAGENVGSYAISQGTLSAGIELHDRLHGRELLDHAGAAECDGEPAVEGLWLGRSGADVWR